MTVKQLRAALGEAGASTQGNKPELLQRLLGYTHYRHAYVAVHVVKHSHNIYTRMFYVYIPSIYIYIYLHMPGP